MEKKIMTFALIMIAIISQAQTLEECQQAAKKNYPCIKKYDLIYQTTELTVKNIKKGWLPHFTASAQTTYQSEVASWPQSMQSMFQQMGLKMKGLTKEQYKVGIELQQTIYDGGIISNQSQIAQQEGKIQAAQNESDLYQVRKRINEMYFSLLLLDEQIKLNENLNALLLSSENKLAAWVKAGTASISDFDNVKAERLSTEQQMANLKSQRKILQHVLSTFCGIEVSQPQKPSILHSTISTNNRPELRIFDNQLKLTEIQERALNAELRPKFGLFAQGYYGYPGLNIFEDMMSNKWRLNGIVGLKLSWNIGALYSRKNDKEKLKKQRAMIENIRDVFLFNNNIEQIQQTENISRYHSLMQSDDEIIVLRTNVRKAAESKLTHGIIDVNSLLREIYNENSAKTQRAIHEIDMLQEMYNLKYTNNE
jgi:outer membrane efflux protein